MLIGLMLASGIITGCASNSTHEQTAQSDPANISEPRDPLESVNRVMWTLNWDYLDKYLIRPVTVGYVTVMPQFVRTGLVNATNNLEEPANFLNNMLQGDLNEGMDSLGRFFINSTVGLLGTIDVASKMGIERQRERFGETLAVWGVKTGPFLMLPVLGPSDPRTFSGRVADGYTYPNTILNTNFNIATIVISLLEGRAALLDQEQQLEQSFDQYSFVKNAYFQNLKFRVSDGEVGTDQINVEEQEENFDDFESLLGEGDN
nr:VacJ family lipoprotein [Salinimonas chungwhensis]